MKNKGLFLSILFILCLGIFVTVNTRRFVSDSSGKHAAPETYRSSMLPELKRDERMTQGDTGAGGELAQIQAEAYSADIMAAPDAPAAADSPAVPSDVPAAPAAEAGNQAAETLPVTEDTQALPAPASRMMPDGGVASDEESMAVLISPLTGSKESSESFGTPVNKKADYEKKLQDLDTQINNMKTSEVEPNTDSYKNMADYEYRQWDSELNAVYQDILKNMSADEVDALRAEEREWIKQRDAAAYKAISKYNGGTIESLEFTASLASSTRARAYELLDNYGGYLDAAPAEGN